MRSLTRQTTIKRSTIIDVAKMVGVTPKTVSRALNDAPHVSAAVRQKVREAAAALDYHPNIAAQSLIARRSYLIGLTYERPSPSYVVELQKGAIDRLEDERYRLVVLPFHNVAQRPAELGRLLVRAGLDGVVLAPPACDQLDILDILDGQRLPYARITPHHDLGRGLSIVMDERAAGRDVAAALITLGHRRFGIILGDRSHSASAARLAGYRDAFAAAAITVADDWIAEGDFTYDTGYGAAADLLAHSPPPTAILAQNDDMAVAAMAAARDRGLSIPGDISVAGFDNSEISRTAWPQVTTVDQPVSDMAWSAVDFLVTGLKAGSILPRQEQRTHRLLVRASTGPAL